MIAIDSSVLIDLLGEDARAGAAELSLRDALAHGPVVLCDVVVSRDLADDVAGDFMEGSP